MEKIDMIELRTNPDYLHSLAADTREAGRDETAKDLDNAAHDIKNLRDYGWTLEKTMNETSAEIQSWKDKAAEMETRAEAREENYNAVCAQRDAAAAALLAIIRPELETMVNKLINEQVENLETEIDDLKTQCEDIPNDDQISDSIREWFQYEAKFSITLD
jgi:chromosome segregation ATPase